MKTANASRFEVTAAAFVTAAVCAFLLAIPASVYDWELPFAAVGMCFGAVLGASTVTGRVSLPLVGAVFGGLTGLTLGFGYEWGKYGSNLLMFQQGFSRLWDVILVFGSIGAVLGLAQRIARPGFRRTVIWPLGALLPIAAAFLWSELWDRRYKQPDWGNELVIALHCIACCGRSPRGALPFLPTASR